MSASRYDYGLTRYRLPEGGQKFEPESITVGSISAAAEKLTEWSEGAIVVLDAAEYAVLRGALDEKQAAAAAAFEPEGEPTTDETTGGPEPDPAAAPSSDEPSDTPSDDAWAEPIESGLATPPASPAR